jgi:hypothetical protein
MSAVVHSKAEDTYDRERAVWLGWLERAYHYFGDAEAAFCMVAKFDAAYVFDMRYPQQRLTVAHLNKMIAEAKRRVTAMEAARDWLAANQVTKQRKK